MVGLMVQRPVRLALLCALVSLAVLGCASASEATSTDRSSPSPAHAPPLVDQGPPTSGETFRPTGPTETAKVVRIVDGDTIIVRLGGQDRRLRYIGMDTPETVAPGVPIEWLGREASRANAALVEGRTVTLEKDVSETDRYGRLLRYVWQVDGECWTLVNLELVRQGYAQVETDPPDVRYATLFVEAQRSARDAGLGLWAPASSTEP
jgi:micrococcal nuclease